MIKYLLTKKELKELKVIVKSNCPKWMVNSMFNALAARPAEARRKIAQYGGINSPALGRV